MKKTIPFFFSALILMSFTSFNNCDKLIFFKEGTSTTLSHFDNDGKPTGTTKTLYKKVTKTGSDVTVSAYQENYDKKGKLATQSDYTIKCQNGTLYFDMRMMLPQQQAEAYKDFQMTVEGADKEMPSTFVVGSSLKDANIKFLFKTKDGADVPMMTMSINITNRKVEAKESITTAAGTFECFKVSEDIEMKSLFSMKMKSISWFNSESGLIKTESYKDNGKLTGKSELTEIKLP